MARSAESYKQLSIREFTKAANNYESGKAGIYKMCRKDYPPILAEIRTEPFPQAAFVGLDLTPEMIRKAEQKQLPNAEFVVGDCEAMPFADGRFDLVINSQSFHHYPDPQAFFNEVARVLKPNGRLILRDNTGPRAVMWFINHVELPLANLIGHGDVKAHSLDEVRAFCEKAGLRVEKLERQKGFRLHLVARKSA